MNESIPLPFGVPAVSGLQALNDRFQAWALHSGEIGNVAFPPEADARGEIGVCSDGWE